MIYITTDHLILLVCIDDDNNLLVLILTSDELSQGLPVDKVRSYSFQLTLAVLWCHERDVVHRDIKPGTYKIILVARRFAGASSLPRLLS